MRDFMFMKRANQHYLTKDCKSIINACDGKTKFPLTSANQAKKLINSGIKFVLLFLTQNQQRDELLEMKASLEGCTKEKKNNWRHTHKF